MPTNEESLTAPGLEPEDKVVLFDGVCRLCSAWSRFLIRFDKNRIFKLATVQSPQGQAILKWHGLSLENVETMLVVEGSEVFTKSNAFLQVMKQLPWPWPAFHIGKIIPRVIRDWLYDRVALNRYKLFGQLNQCQIPSKENMSRFLGEQP